jgi:hypothetical protein
VANMIGEDASSPQPSASLNHGFNLDRHGKEHANNPPPKQCSKDPVSGVVLHRPHSLSNIDCSTLLR